MPDPVALRVVSFGYGHNDPLPVADLTVDVRDHFRDPHIDPALREMTGRDQAVVDKVLSTPGVRQFVAALYDTTSVLAGLQSKRARALVVAVGCVGGRHRSVVIANELGGMAVAAGWVVEVEHLHVDLPVLVRGERRYFVDVDGGGDLTLWRTVPGRPDFPDAIGTRARFDSMDPLLWPTLTRVLAGVRGDRDE